MFRIIRNYETFIFVVFLRCKDTKNSCSRADKYCIFAVEYFKNQCEMATKERSLAESTQTNSERKLFAELSGLIEQSQRKIASYANNTLTVLFWQVGKRINDDVL